MKTLFSLKKKVGSILVAAAMLASAIPGFVSAATVTEDPELLTNGNFQSYRTLSEDETYGSNIISSGQWVPNDWTIGAVATTNGVYLNGSNVRQLHLGYKSSVSQNVKGIEPCTTYALNFDYLSKDLRVLVDFMHYDAETDTYSTLAEYVTAYNAKTPDDTTDDIALAQVAFGGGNAMKDYTSVGTYYKSDNYPASSKSTVYLYENWVNESLNFTTPPYTNAVKVTFEGDASVNHSYVDNVSLKKGNEIVNDGGFRNIQAKNGPTTSRYWRGLAVVDHEFDENGTLVNSAYHNTAGGTNNFWHYVVGVAGKTYKYRVKYKSDLEGQENLVPRVWSYANIGNALTNPTVKAVGTDGDWTIYEGYWTAVNNNGGELVNFCILPWSGVDSGEVSEWFDDFSLTEVTTLTLTQDGKAQVRYSQDKENGEAKLILASYNRGTKELADVEIVDIGGADAKVGRFYTYTQDLNEDYEVKAYLWDGVGSMKPLTPTVTKQPSSRALPVNEAFDTEGELSIDKGWKTVIPENAGTISVADGALTSYADATNQYWKWAELDLETISSGKVIFEYDATYGNTVNGGFWKANDVGLFEMFNDDGTSLAGIWAEGSSALYMNGYLGSTGYASKIAANSFIWINGNTHFKVVVDLDNDTWQVYQSNPNTTVQWMTQGNDKDAIGNDIIATSDFSFRAGVTNHNISKIAFGMRNNCTIDNLKIYRPEVAPINQTFGLSELSGAWTLNYPAPGSYKNDSLANAGTIAIVDGRLVATGAANANGEDCNAYRRNAAFKFDTVSEGIVVIEADLYNRSSGFSAGPWDPNGGNVGLLDVYNANGEKLVYLQADDRTAVYVNGYGTGTGGNDSKVANLISLGSTRIRIELDLAGGTYKVYQQQLDSNGVTGEEVQWTTLGETNGEEVVIAPQTEFAFKTAGAAANVSSIAVGMRVNDTAIDNLKIYQKTAE